MEQMRNIQAAYKSLLNALKPDVIINDNYTFGV